MNAVAKSVVVVLASLAITFSVSAQSPADKQEPQSPELKAAVTEMLDAINFRQMMNQMSVAMAQSTPQMVEQLSSRMLEKLPPAEQKVAKEKAAVAAKAGAERAMALYRDPEIIKGMEDIMVRAYARRFSLVEIKSITAFYRSDAGKKMMSATPQMMQEMMPEIAALTSPKMNALMDELMKTAMEDAKAASEAKKAATAK